MFLPASHLAGVVLLVMALLCFAAWPNLFKQVQGSWRYELFALDFAIGAFASALLLAYTIGTLGPEMSFSDRLLISGGGSAVTVVGAGAVFALANLLLLASVALIGAAAAFPVCFAVAALGIALPRIHSGDTIAPLIGALLLIIAAVVTWNATRAAGSGNRRTNAPRGLALAVASGVTCLVAKVGLRIVSNPDFGPGPYATALLFALGLVLATPCLNFFFMNIKVLGSQIRFASYRVGGFSVHIPGLLSGVLWTGGLLALYCALSITGFNEVSERLVFVVPALAVPLVMGAGLIRWREYGAAPRARKLLQVSAVCFALGLLGAAFAFE